MRVVRSPWLLAGTIALSLATLAGCSATEINTDAGAPTTAKAKTPEGTVKSNSGGILKGGFAASIASSNDPRAAAVGALVDIHLPKPEETTTTTAVVVETTTTEAPVVVTTAKPVVTTAPPTLPPLTQPTLPPTVPPTTPAPSKPNPTPISSSSLTPDEQTVFAKINETRAAHGLPALTLEKYATDAAHPWALQNAQSGQSSTISNLLTAVPAQYALLQQVEFSAPPASFAQSVINASSAYSDPAFQYVGVGVGTASNGVKYWVIIVGQGF